MNENKDFIVNLWKQFPFPITDLRHLLKATQMIRKTLCLPFLGALLLSFTFAVALPGCGSSEAKFETSDAPTAEEDEEADDEMENYEEGNQRMQKEGN